MRSIITIVFTVIFSVSGISQNWEKINTGYSYILKAIDFPGGQSNTGYAGGQSVTYMGDGIVIKTTNSGTTWTQLWTGTDQGLEGMSWPDLQTGYVCGWSGYFAKTTNGGTSWTLQTPGSDIYYYTDVEFKDLNNGVVAASTNTSGGGIWITSNGGTTWIAGSGLTGVPVKLVHVSGDTYFLVTTGGDILKSTNNGLNWTISYDGSGLLTGIDFYNTNTGIAAGEDGRILKTYDGGNTWQQQIIANGNPLWHDFAWADANNVIAVGTPEQIWRSLDGGSNWSDDYPQSTYNPALYEARYTNDGIAFICGSQGWFYRKAPLLTAAFTASQTEICNGTNVQFTDNSVGNPTAWNWIFEGGVPATSTLQNPIVNYPNPGVFDVTLMITKGTMNNTNSSADLIHVDDELSVAPSQPTGPAAVCGTTINQYITIAIQGITEYQWSVSPGSAGTITGTGLTGTFTASNNWSGDYQVTVRGLNNCGMGPQSAPALGSLTHKPIAYSIYEGGSYCEGDPGVEILLENSEIGVNYQLYNYGNAIGGLIPGTGDQLNFGYHTEGEYTITGHNEQCITDMLGMAYVFVGQAPGNAQTPAGPVESCSGESTLYTAQYPEDALYLTWILSPPESGIITNPNYNTALVQWNPDFSGIASLSFYGSNSCGNGGVCVPLDINILMTPYPEVTGNNQTCINYRETYTTENVSGNSYEWEVTGGAIESGQGTNSIQVIWSVTGQGTVKVTETTPEGCETISSDLDVAVELCSNTQSISVNHLIAYPNPVKDVLFLNLPDNLEGTVRIKIYNSKGTLMKEEGLKKLSDNILHSLDLHALDNGVYFMRITSESTTTVNTRIIKI